MQKDLLYTRRCGTELLAVGQNMSSQPFYNDHRALVAGVTPLFPDIFLLLLVVEREVCRDFLIFFAGRLSDMDPNSKFGSHSLNFGSVQA